VSDLKRSDMDMDVVEMVAELKKQEKQVKHVVKTIKSRDTIIIRGHEHLLKMLRKPRNRVLSVVSVEKKGEILDGSPIVVHNKKNGRKWFVRMGRLASVSGKGIPSRLIDVFVSGLAVPTDLSDICREGARHENRGILQEDRGGRGIKFGKSGLRGKA